MRTSHTSNLRTWVAQRWIEGTVASKHLALELVFTELGRSFQYYLEAHGYRGYDEVLSRLDDKIQSHGSDGDVHRDTAGLYRAVERVQNDGSPLWDVSSGPERAKGMGLYDLMRWMNHYNEHDELRSFCQAHMPRSYFTE